MPLLVATVAAVLTGPALSPAGADSSLRARLDDLATAYHDNAGFEGGILVARRGEVVYEAAFGYANREWKIPNTTDTRFLIASVTKPITAAVVVRLAQEGRIDLQAPITTYLPDYRRDTGTRVTVHHLLCHSSGIPNFAVWPDFWNESPPRMKYDHHAFMKEYCSGDLLFEPGSDSKYSDSNYYLLGLIIESASGMSYGEALSKWILEPLGMHDTGVVREGAIIERRAYGYLTRNGHFSSPQYINYEDTQLGAGNLYSTLEDMLRFDRALYGDALLNARFRDLMFEKHSFSGFSGMYNGYGWNLGVETLRDSGREVRIAHAPGNNAGFTTVLYRIPDGEWTIVVAANVGPGPFDPKVLEMCREITHVCFSETPVVPLPSIVTEISAALDAGGVAAARKAYESMKRSGAYDLDIRGMNRLGYQLLGSHRVEEAIAVFQWNVESDPESANAYDSLGEAYMTHGDRNLAITNYRKSLDLNPENENARKMLEKLGVN